MTGGHLSTPLSKSGTGGAEASRATEISSIAFLSKTSAPTLAAGVIATLTPEAIAG